MEVCVMGGMGVGNNRILKTRRCRNVCENFRFVTIVEK